MSYRKLGKTNFEISEVSLGTWQAGGKWGETFDQKNAETIINEAIDAGVNFIDTADVYSDRFERSGGGKSGESKKRTGLYCHQVRQARAATSGRSVFAAEAGWLRRRQPEKYRAEYLGPDTVALSANGHL